MADERNAFESWDGDEGAPPRRSSPMIRRARPAIPFASLIPTGRVLPMVLLVLILTASAVVAGELTRSGPFATTAVQALAAKPVSAAPGGGAAPQSAALQGAAALQEPDVRLDLPAGHWNWQLVATGTGNGSVDVRAWELSRACDGSRCRLQLAREVLPRTAPDGATDRATLHLFAP